jgi:hypothetical protein
MTSAPDADRHRGATRTAEYEIPLSLGGATTMAAPVHPAIERQMHIPSYPKLIDVILI